MILATEPQPASWQLPPAMSDTAGPVDSTYNFIFWFSVVFLVVITAAMLYFVVKYKRKKGELPLMIALKAQSPHQVRSSTERSL